MTEVIGFINKKGEIFKFKNSLDRQQVEQIIGETQPCSHTHNISDITNIPTIPTKISDLLNDSGFLTSHLDISGKVDKVTSAINGNLVEFGSDGILVDSGTKTSNFASSLHGHDIISHSGDKAHVSCDYDDEDGGKIELYIEDENGDGDSVEITESNIGNLYRALTAPSSIPENDATKLITSKAVYDALSDKMNGFKEIYIEQDDTFMWEIPLSGEEAFRDALVWDENAPRLIIVNLSKYTGDGHDDSWDKYRTIGSIHAVSEEVDTDSYDLTAHIYVDGYVFERSGREVLRETTWDQGLTLSVKNIFMN